MMEWENNDAKVTKKILKLKKSKINHLETSTFFSTSFPPSSAMNIFANLLTFFIYTTFNFNFNYPLLDSTDSIILLIITKLDYFLSRILIT